jgi:DNA-binding NtrC family response regulator
MYGPRNKRAYIVDDEPLVASTLSIIRETWGFESRFFTAPIEALHAAVLDPPDLLLSDVIMPRMSGMALAIRLQQQFPWCRVLLLSGQAGTDDLLRLARADGYDFTLMSKPAHPRDILKMIEAIFAAPPHSGQRVKRELVGASQISNRYMLADLDYCVQSYALRSSVSQSHRLDPKRIN